MKAKLAGVVALCAAIGGSMWVSEQERSSADPSVLRYGGPSEVSAATMFSSAGQQGVRMPLVRASTHKPIGKSVAIAVTRRESDGKCFLTVAVSDGSHPFGVAHPPGEKVADGIYEIASVPDGPLGLTGDLPGVGRVELQGRVNIIQRRNGRVVMQVGERVERSEGRYSDLIDCSGSLT